MEGIRLRSDSDGSVKCAFYQGTIVSSPPGTYFARRTANGQNKEIKSWDGEQGRTRLQEVANVAYASLSEPKHHIPESNTDKLKLTSLTTLAMRGDQAKPNVTSNLVSFTMPMVGTGDDETRMNGEHESLHYSDFSVSTQQNPLGIGFLKGNSRASVGLTMPGAALAGEGLDLYSDGLASRTMDEKQLYPSSSTSKKMAIPSDGRLAYRLRSRGGKSNRFDDSAGSGVSFSHPGILPPYPVQEVANNKFPNYKAILVTPKSRHMGPYGLTAGFKHGIEERDELYSEEQESASATLSERSINRIAGWLSLDVKFDEDGTPYFDAGKTIRGILRDLFYNPIHPEFTSLQQFSWAVLIGIFMGVYTAFWKSLIEGCVDFMWKDVPEMLLDWGVFTDTNGRFPIYHYMWIVPALFGGSLSYVFAALPTPIPSQNEWIHNLHSRGVQSADTFVPLFILSTAGMASGLSLGPELPLILTSGMIGSWLGVLCKQSMLQARVLNLTAASAAIGGFFGFPMAGALFVLELPHRMGLQYFEALSPATIASIVAVLTNRLVTGNDVTGYYSYPFLNESLPSQIFKHAIVYGVFGGALGIFYTKVVLALKHFVHDMFRRENDNNCGGNARDFGQYEETVPLVAKVSSNIRKEKLNDFENPFVKIFACAVPHEPTRAAVSGTIVGIIVGVTCMFIPHVMFWGEAQLQSLIDKGRTPLPVFGHGDEASAGLVALGYCLIDENSAESNKSGFSLGCSAAITLAKVFVTGLSLGTGIVGGHFWAPLFVGCAASHFLTDFVDTITTKYGVSSGLSAYPCVALLCIMGSTHVVTFRAHIAIILILTLTIEAFDPEGDVGGGFKVAGDYSAVFPLLTVAVFVALQISRKTTFYEKQRSRGDIMALPEVLCEPGKEGKPLVMDYKGDLHELDESVYGYESDTDDTDSWSSNEKYRAIDGGTSQHDIEAIFEAKNQPRARGFAPPHTARPNHDLPLIRNSSIALSETSSNVPSPLPPRPQGVTISSRRQSRASSSEGSSARATAASSLRIFDDLLDGPIKAIPANEKRHRRTKSEPVQIVEGAKRKKKNRDKMVETSSQRRSAGGVALKRVTSFGQVDQEQPSLLDQARKRAASFDKASESHR